MPLHEGPGGLGRGAHGGVGLGAGAAEAGVLRVGDEEQGQVPAWPGLPSPRGQDCGEGQQLDLHVLEIVELLVWLVVVSMLGMPRKENGYSTLLISHRRGNINREAPIIELVPGGGSPSNHHSVIMNSPLVGLQHTSDIRVELGIKEGAKVLSSEVLMDMQPLGQSGSLFSTTICKQKNLDELGSRSGAAAAAHVR